MDAPAAEVRDLLGVAARTRAGGDPGAARAAYEHAFDVARELGDVIGMTEAALALSAGPGFGAFPGRGPALLRQAHDLARGSDRARVAVALTRAWVYGGDPARAVHFATEAVDTAEEAGDPVLLAAALDAQLLVHWGPDDLPARLAITRRLEDVVAHLPDTEARMTAHLWRLTTALECLDPVAMRRQLRALDTLATDSGSPRVRFFAASRRAMHALLAGHLPVARAGHQEAVRAGTDAAEPDTVAVDHALGAAIARQTGDPEALAREATAFEQFGAAEGIVVITAEAAELWLAAGEPARADALLQQLVGSGSGGLAAVPRDVDWGWTVTELATVALGTGASALLEQAVPLLAPHAGRGVVDAGAVGFGGVGHDLLYRVFTALGRDAEAAEQRAAAGAAYRRLGADWWVARLAAAPPGAGRVRPAGRPAGTPARIHLHPAGPGVWRVGWAGATRLLPAARGLAHLRLLLQRPGAEVPALELAAAVAGHPGVQTVQADLGPVLDAQALQAYRGRLVELEQDLTEAREWADPVRADRLAAERSALLAGLAAAHGLGGRDRPAGSDRERARVAVRKAISSALAHLGEVDPGLARLLQDTVHTGGTCRYDPDPDRPVRWVLDPAEADRVPGRGPPRERG